MGKRGHNRGRGSSSAGSGTQRNGRGQYNDVAPSNPTFDKYYRAQGIVDEQEWPEFIGKCAETLPTTFRVTASRAVSAAVNDQVEKVFVPFLSNVEYDGVKQSPPTPLQWYPGHLAWQLDVAKHVVRKSPEFAKFQQFLVHETDSGNISRQEAVSMIPPLLLDVRPHHHVLDCCAAPGSKTVQLLEALHSGSLSGHSATSIPSGLLIANDSDAKRCHMLVHQSLNRVGSPNTMITNLDATVIPNIRVPNKTTGKIETLRFDRILCDVPCSGDGTMRKNINIWRTWRTGDGLGLHSLQLRILARAIRLLKPGGRLVYSTCSFNPIENEAIVSAALEAHPEMSLEDVADKLPGLKRRPGLTTWKVFNKEMQEVDASASVQTDGKVKGPAATCFPNGKEAERNLTHCLRLYPHLQNTGGFFVAVLRKEAGAVDPAEDNDIAADITDEVPQATLDEPISSNTKRSLSPTAEDREGKRGKTMLDESDASASALPAVTSRKVIDKATEGGGRPFNEDPYSFLSPSDEQVQTCLDFFNFNPDFPVENLFVRNGSGQPLRSIYLTSPTVRTIIESNDYARLRLVSCGVRLIARQDSGASGVYRCRWRILQDGLNVASAYMGETRKVKAGLSTLRELMSDLYPPLDRFKDGTFRKRISEMETGSCLCEFEAGEDEGGRLANSIQLPLWIAPNSLCLMVEKQEKRGISLRVFGEDLTKTKSVTGKAETDEQDDNQANVVAPDVDNPAEVQSESMDE